MMAKMTKEWISWTAMAAVSGGSWNSPTQNPAERPRNTSSVPMET